MPERFRESPQAIEPNMGPVNTKMQDLLNRCLYLPKRHPLEVEYYDWDKIRPRSIDPDFVNCLRFVALVESNPDAPAKNLLRAADAGGATWQRRFVEETWLPEEHMHGVVLRELAIRCGTSQPLIDEEIEQVRAREFTIGTNYSSLKTNIYGWLQEATTWMFYRAMASATDNPVIKKVLTDISTQENFHRFIYFQGAKSTLANNPNLSRQVVETVGEFVMPGYVMAPELQPEAPRWAKKFNFPTSTLLHEEVTGLLGLVGHQGLGKSLIAYGAKNSPLPLLRPLLSLLSKASIPPVYYLTGRAVEEVSKRDQERQNKV